MKISKKGILEIVLSGLGTILVLIIVWLGLNTTIKDDGNRYLTIKIKYQSDADSVLQAKKNEILELAYKVEDANNPPFDEEILINSILKANNISYVEFSEFKDKKYIKWTDELKEFNKKNTKLLDSLKEN